MFAASGYMKEGPISATVEAEMSLNVYLWESELVCC